MRRLWVILAVAAVAIVLLIPMNLRQDLGWIDSISGSQKSQTVWRFGPASSPVVSESLLAARYLKLGLQWEPDWRNVKGTYSDVFGRNLGSAHGSAPEIYDLGLSPDLQQSFLAAASDDDVREFFHVMSSGTEAEKNAAVDAACEKALRELATTPPGT